MSPQERARQDHTGSTPAIENPVHPPTEGIANAAGRPVTVSITREVDPRHLSEVTKWVQAGVNLANTYPGFLGSGWVRESRESWNWHMLYRFRNAETLESWEASTDRREWLARGAHLVREQRVERRTGIEGWFDSPVAGEPAVAAAPPRWKQATSIWLGFFPVNLAFTLLVSGFVPGWDDVWAPAKVLITTLVLTPIMAYWVLPFVTARLRPWLQAPRRSLRDRAGS